MITIKISDPNGIYTTSYFLYTSSGEIYADNENVGFFKHPKIDDGNKLFDHLVKMEKDGFKVEFFR